MLWKQLNPRYRKLLRSGQQGQAVVVTSKADRGGGSNVGPGIYGWNVVIRVRLPNGQTADHERYVEASVAGPIDISPGTILPVRFDPSDPERVEVDTDALRAARERGVASEQAADAARVQAAESNLPPLG